MKAVIFGAGNIGRGFIAPLFSFDGWDVTFVDVSKPVVEQIQKDGKYPLRIVSNEGTKALSVENISAVDGNDIEAAVSAIAKADIAVTCVGAKAIKFILPNFSKAVKRRYAEGKTTDLLICENLMDADSYVHDLLGSMLTAEELESVGLVETSVGRMVPVLKGEKENPLEIAVEEYGVLPVDKGAFKGDVLNVKNIVPFEPFRYYVERKLYIHNMGHAVCAYLGSALYGDEFIWQSISRSEVRLAVQNAMTESAMALSKKYSVPFEPIMEHVWDLIRRFGNRALGDTCLRVGADIPRKLSRADRLIGAAENVISEGSEPVFVALGIACALFTYVKEKTEKTADTVLTELSSLKAGDPVFDLAMKFYPAFESGASLSDIISLADKIKKDLSGMIV